MKEERPLQAPARKPSQWNPQVSVSHPRMGSMLRTPEHRCKHSDTRHYEHRISALLERFISALIIFYVSHRKIIVADRYQVGIYRAREKRRD